MQQADKIVLPDFLDKDYMRCSDVRIYKPGTAPDEDRIDAVCTGLSDHVHNLINNTLRYLGVEVSASLSEGTWDWAHTVGQHVFEMTQKFWQEKNSAFNDKYRELTAARNLVAQLEKELGMIPEEGDS